MTGSTLTSDMAAGATGVMSPYPSVVIVTRLK